MGICIPYHKLHHIVRHLVVVTPFLVVDSVFDDEEVAWAVQGIRMNRSGRSKVTKVEHLREWLQEAMS